MSARRPRPCLALVLALIAACAADKPATSGGGGSGSGGGAGAGGAGGRGGSAGRGGGGGGGGSGGAGEAVAPAADAATPRRDGPHTDRGATGADGGSVDAPGAAGVCGAQVCDDFESYPVGSTPQGPWRPFVRSGTLAIDDRKAFSGGRSLLARNTGAADAKTFLELMPPHLPAGNAVHGRLMFQLTRGPTGANAHWEFVRASGVLTGTTRAQINLGGEAGKFMYNYEPNDCSAYGRAVALPEKRWACFQWQVDGSKDSAGTARSEIRGFIDGTPVDITVRATAGCWNVPTLDTIHIGYAQHHASEPIEIWIDDVAVGTQPILCPGGSAARP
jgi:hypothetical protein